MLFRDVGHPCTPLSGARRGRRGSQGRSAGSGRIRATVCPSDTSGVAVVSTTVASGQAWASALIVAAMAASASDGPRRPRIRRSVSLAGTSQRSAIRSVWVRSAMSVAAAAPRCGRSRRRQAPPTRPGLAASRPAPTARCRYARSSPGCRCLRGSGAPAGSPAPKPASSLRTRSLLSSVQPSRSASPPASVDLPVPGRPPTSTRTTDAVARCRWVTQVRARASPAAVVSPCWYRRQATLALTKAR
jgi:hypothetical protein